MPVDESVINHVVGSTYTICLLQEEAEQLIQTYKQKIETGETSSDFDSKIIEVFEKILIRYKRDKEEAVLYRNACELVKGLYQPCFSVDEKGISVLLNEDATRKIIEEIAYTVDGVFGYRHAQHKNKAYNRKVLSIQQWFDTYIRERIQKKATTM